MGKTSGLMEGGLSPQDFFNPWVDGSSPSGPTHPSIRRILTDVKSILGSQATYGYVA